MKPFRFFLTCLMLIVVCFFVIKGNQAVADSAGDAPEPVALTTGDPTISDVDLSILLRPLTKEEIAVEKDAWLALLRSNVQKISKMEIAVKYRNAALDRINDLKGALETLQSALSSAEEAHEVTDTSLTVETKNALTESEKAVKDSREKVREAIQKLIDTERAAARLVNVSEIAEAIRGSVTKKLETPEATSEDSLLILLLDESDRAMFSEQVAALRPSLDTLDRAAVEELLMVSEEMTSYKDTTKALLVDYLNALVKDRRQLIARVSIVLEAWQIKGATEEELLPHRKYIDAVDEIRADVIDTATKWSLLTGWFTSEDGGMLIAKRAVKFLASLFVFFLLALLIGKVTEKALERMQKLSRLLRNFVVRSIRRVVLVIGLVISLSFLGINIGPILALVGAAGFILAFALQETLGNFASGLMIMFYKPFDVGDIIDAAGVSGKVDSMNLTSTIMKTFDNKLIIVPNSSIWGNVITNITGSNVRRIDMVFGIGYGDNIADAERILTQIIEEHELILDNPQPVVRVHELGDSSVNFVCRPWVKTEHYWDVYWDVTRAVKERFDKEGVSIPFPQRDVHIYEEVVSRDDDASG